MPKAMVMALCSLQFSHILIFISATLPSPCAFQIYPDFILVHTDLPSKMDHVNLPLVHTVKRISYRYIPGGVAGTLHSTQQCSLNCCISAHLWALGLSWSSVGLFTDGPAPHLSPSLFSTCTFHLSRHLTSQRCWIELEDKIPKESFCSR